MESMQEEEFDKLEKTVKDGEKCSHDVVKLYYLGTHTDYGCIKCKRKSAIKEYFENHL